jgi:dipeptidyl aminopeptidase/acylaminoacyl peptidase
LHQSANNEKYQIPTDKIHQQMRGGNMQLSEEKRQFGLWDSPISPLSLGRGITLADVAWDSDGSLVWREGRSDRGVLVVKAPGEQAPRDLNSELSVRAKVGYGGGDFCAGHGNVYFAEAESGRIFRQPTRAGVAQPVTPAFGAAAAPTLSPDGQWLIYVHTYEGTDRVAIVDSQGIKWPDQLVSGDDFYMQPRWHPGGTQVAWIAWKHPNMPWDGTYLRQGKLEFPAGGLPIINETQTIAGDENTSIFQPEYSPDGRWLAYVSDESGWWQLYLYDLQSGTHRQLTHEPAEHGMPAWVQGLRVYAFSPDSHSIYFIRNSLGRNSLWRVEIVSGQMEQLPLGLGYTSLEQIALSPSGKLGLIASGAGIPQRLVVLDPAGETQVVARATSEEIDPQVYSPAEAIEWTGMDGGRAYGLFYPPHNPGFQGEGLPPLVIDVHGGPTSQVKATFLPRAQFFTSRGYAVLVVNYRGSTGYGREYRNALRGNWGIYDVQDSVSGAQHLAAQGRVDGGRVVIMGGSAGGFTVLKALEDFPGFFKAGLCLYGVSNQFTLVADTHKFEERYSDTLLGPLPQAAEVYRERSPEFFCDQIQDPIAIFQGEDDVVVPRSQSDRVVASLQRRGIPHEYHLYPGEGHGFRKSETIADFYEAVDKFLKQHVIYA